MPYIILDSNSLPTDVRSYDYRQKICEYHRCGGPATHRVGNTRGEGIRVCREHLEPVKAELIIPIVSDL